MASEADGPARSEPRGTLRQRARRILRRWWPAPPPAAADEDTLARLLLRNPNPL